MDRNAPCWCGSGKKWKKCHFPQLNQSFEELQKTYLRQWGILLKTPQQIAGIRNASKITAMILKEVAQAAQKGVTTLELDDLSRQLHKKWDATPACLGYGSPPFPASICTSLNEVICHGIPSKEKLKDGDILNIDVSSIVDGYYGDTSCMVMIGDVGHEKQTLVEVTHECLLRAISILKPGIMVHEIGDVIEEIAKKHNFSVVNEFVAHGVGTAFHEPPQIPHCHNQLMIPLAPGMTFTIEPMINAGQRKAVIDSKDCWTARTIDGKPSAQWEHTLLITETGHEILTL